MEKYKVFLSIITPTFNRVSLLPDMVKSVLRQRQDIFSWELIFVDEESTDGTRRYIEMICKTYDNFRCLSSNKKSIAHARNLGFLEAKGEWILLLDSDNLLQEDAFEKMRNAFDLVKDISCDGLWFVCQRQDGSRISWKRGDPRKLIELDRSTYFSDFRGAEVVHCLRTAWIRQNLYPLFPGAKAEFAETIWLKMVFSRRLYLVNLVVQIYRNHSGSTSNAPYTESKLVERNVYERLLSEEILRHGMGFSRYEILRFLKRVCFSKLLGSSLRSWGNMRFYPIAYRFFALFLDLIPPYAFKVSFELYLSLRRTANRET